MKIEIQNKKKIPLVILFLLIIFLSFVWFFYLGYEYGKSSALNFDWRPYIIYKNNFPQTEWNEKNWETFVSNDFGFSFRYPRELEVENPVGVWRYFANNDLGIQLARLKIPKIYEINTNFTEAYFNVGVSSSTKDIQDCFLPGKGESASSTLDIGNATFYQFFGEFVADGNFYQVKSYRTLRHNVCYDIDLIIHFTDINSYPSDFNLQNFNQQKVDDLLNKVLNTFYFTN